MALHLSYQTQLATTTTTTTATITTTTTTTTTAATLVFLSVRRQVTLVTKCTDFLTDSERKPSNAPLRHNGRISKNSAAVNKLLTFL